MTTSSLQLQKRIMRRVWAIHILKRVLSPVMVQSYILAFLVWQVVELVHVRSVFANAPSVRDVSGFFNFYLASFTHTEVAVQLLLVGSAVMLVWLARTVARLGAPKHTAVHS